MENGERKKETHHVDMVDVMNTTQQENITKRKRERRTKHPKIRANSNNCVLFPFVI